MTLYKPKKTVERRGTLVASPDTVGICVTYRDTDIYLFCGSHEEMDTFIKSLTKEWKRLRRFISKQEGKEAVKTTEALLEGKA